MEEFLDVLLHAPLFRGMNEQKILSMLTCLAAHRHNYQKGEYLLHAGEPVEAFGLVLEGCVHVMQEDFWGNRNIIVDIGVGEIFAESYACSAGTPLGVNVVAQENSTILFLNVRRALTTCSSACEFHSALIRNLVALLAAKNLLMNEKLQHVTQRSTREKLLSFLSAQSGRWGSATFEIQFNRQQLADYLSVDRSAMSSELCKLRDEGVLSFERNRFKLYACND